jgi:hypothetical protein
VEEEISVSTALSLIMNVPEFPVVTFSPNRGVLVSSGLAILHPRRSLKESQWNQQKHEKSEGRVLEDASKEVNPPRRIQALVFPFYSGHFHWVHPPIGYLFGVRQFSVDLSNLLP